MNSLPLAPGSDPPDARVWLGALPAHLALRKQPRQLLQVMYSLARAMRMVRALERTQQCLATFRSVQVTRPVGFEPPAHSATPARWTPRVPMGAAAN